MDWKLIKQLFLERYFPTVVQDQLRVDFINLIQGSLSVSGYEAQFIVLSRFAPEMVSTGELKCRKFEDGVPIYSVVCSGECLY